MSVPTHEEIHADHRLWKSHIQLWRDDLRAWQDELAAAQGELETLRLALGAQEEALRQHGAAIRLVEHDSQRHEQALAGFERGQGPLGLLELAQEHGQEAVRFEAQRQNHERLKRRVHGRMAQWRLLLKAFAE